MKSIKLLLIVAASAVTIWGCEKNPVATQSLISIELINAIYKGDSKFVLSAKVQDEAAGMISECGFYLSENSCLQNGTKKESQLTGSWFSCDATFENPDIDYYCCAYISNGRMEICSDPLRIEAGAWDDYNTIPLEHANCFIISKSGTYKYKTVKGNSTTSVGNVSSVEVLWESFGTSVTPTVGDLIADVSYSNGYITFSTNSSFKEGNAVIAAKDANGTILWSWHIWLTDEPQGQTYYNDAGVMMDRNLGATSATPGDVGALGLFYQWGRKDPFLGSSSISHSVEAESTISWPSTVSSSSSTGTIDYAVKHPTTFITENSNNYDWYYTSSESTDDTRWKSQKTIYDPCPAGWRVPDGGANGVWAKAVGSSSYFSYYYNSTNEGMNFSGKFGSATTIWYPASGYLCSSVGALCNVGYNGYYWSVTQNGSYAYYLYIYNNDNVNPAVNNYRSYGQSVRCLQE